MAFFDIFAYAILLGLFLFRTIPYKLRALILVFLGLSVGVVVFFATGDKGAGLFWVFAIPPLANLLLGLGWGLAFYTMTVVLFVGIGALIASNLSLSPALNKISLDSWIVYAVNFLVANAIVTVPLGALLAGLFRSADGAKRRLENLQALNAIDRAIITNLDLKPTLSALLKETIMQLQVDAAAVWLSDKAGQRHFSQGEAIR